jgi:hypothetical protein
MNPNLDHAAHVAGAVRLAQIAPTATRWLWPRRIPLGRITLLVSDPGLGKSLLTLDIAARVSAGIPWPDEPQAQNVGPKAEGSASSDAPPSPLRLPPSIGCLTPSSVLLLNAEDDLAETIRPRLEAHGADCDKILAVSNIPGENAADVPRTFALNRDLARLQNLLDAIPDCRLMVIDPISAYLGGTSEHSNADVRTLLAALADLARQRHLAVLMVSHLRKKEGAAVYRAMGSLAFVAAARAVWMLSRDATDCNKRLMLPLKNNLAPDVGGLACLVESSPDGRVPILRWLPEPVTQAIDDLLGGARLPGRPDDERQHAVQWLRERLARGPRPTRDIHQEADAHGLSRRTLRRAFRDLHGVAVRQGTFPHGQWLWKLPDVDGQNVEREYWTSSRFIDDLLKTTAERAAAIDIQLPTN